MNFLIDYNLTGDAVLFWGTLAAEGWVDLLSILTIGNPDRFYERGYREKCSARLVDILLDIENYMGAGRIFIP
jgi:hypothetical protein